MPNRIKDFFYPSGWKKKPKVKSQSNKFQNHSGNIQTKVKIKYPSSDESLKSILDHAKKYKKRVRVVGNGFRRRM